jgi:DNA-binding response OmpR family regulator
MTLTVPEDSAPKRSPLTIVLAEDDIDQRFMLAVMLRSAGYRVSETGDGEALRSHLKQVVPAVPVPPPDLLVVSDLRLRGPDALTVLRELRDEGRVPRFILLTAFLSDEVYRSARDLGALAVFGKPFDYDDLRLVIHYLDGTAGA